MSLHIERRGPVMVLTMDRPHARNAVDPAQADRLYDAFIDGQDDDDVRAIVLTGAGGHFCAGADLKSVADSPWSYDPEGERGPLGPTRLRFSKPVIAAVEGFAVAGGLELALMCDLRVASETAVFGVYCRRWGVPLIDGGTVRLPRLIGQSRALDMILTGRGVDAQEAHAWGLANRLAREGEALSDAINLATEIAALPQVCMLHDRASALDQWSLDMPEALRNEARIGAHSLAAGAREGAERFAKGAGRGGAPDKADEG